MCPLDFRPTQRIVDSLTGAGIARMVRFEVPDAATFAQWVAVQVPDAARRDDVACMSDTVRVVFQVDTTGRVREVRAEKYRYEGTRRCAERIVAASPRWTPYVGACATEIHLAREIPDRRKTGKENDEGNLKEEERWNSSKPMKNSCVSH